jgi:hypothetical protein
VPAGKYSTVTTMIKPRRMRWEGHAACMCGAEKCIQNFDWSLLSSRYWGIFCWRHCRWGVKMTTNLHLVLRSRMSGAIPKLCFLYIFMAWCLIRTRKNLNKPSQFHIEQNVIVNKYRQDSYWTKNLNRNTKCSLKINWCLAWTYS